MIKKIFDRGFLIPIGIGTLSILGICLVLMIGYLGQPQKAIPTEQTITPFKYLFLGTETFAINPELETSTSKEAFKEASIASATSTITITSIQEQTTSTSIGTPTQTHTVTSNNTLGLTTTATLDETTVLTAGKYDDADRLLEYEGDWISELFVTDAYQETLYFSLEIDDRVTFNFVGKQFIIGYLGDSDFGTLTITIDNTKYTLNQSSGTEWISPQLTQAVHSVIILHESGELANLDYITILE